MVDNYVSFIARRGPGVRLYDGPDLKLVLLIAHRSVYRASDSIYDGPDLRVVHFSWFRLELLVRCLAHRGSTGVFPLLQIFSDVVWRQGLSIAGQLIVSVSRLFCFTMDVIMIVEIVCKIVCP